jgi:poly(beta-D-mannuronate) lyase
MRALLHDAGEFQQMSHPGFVSTGWARAGLGALFFALSCVPAPDPGPETPVDGSGGARATGGREMTPDSRSGGAGSPSGAGGNSGGGGAIEGGGRSGGNAGGTANGGAGSSEGGGNGGAGSAGSGGAGGPTDAAPTPSADGPTSIDKPLPEMASCGRTVMAGDAAALTAAVAAAAPGDCIVVADGSYAGFMITAKGTAESPIIVRAANRGKAVMTGDVQMIGAAYVVVEGFSYTGMASSIAKDSHRCRITRSRFQLGVARATGVSKYTRIDHNEFGPKASGNGHYIHATEMSEFSQIDHNYLHDASGGGTSRDAVSLGCCGPEFDYHDTGNVFEYNLVVNCSSDPEYISIKSSSNTVRYNTFRRNGGTLTLRAGRKNQIYGNFILGGGGIRAYEDDHKIFNNYIEAGTALSANGNGGGHAPLRRATIVHNTFLGGVSIGGTGHTIANNIGGGGGMGNLSAAAAGLMRKGEIMAVTATSGAVDKAVGNFDFVTEDLDGQPRNKPDIGADEWSDAPAMMLRRPLTPADVGPDAP